MSITIDDRQSLKGVLPYLPPPSQPWDHIIEKAKRDKEAAELADKLQRQQEKEKREALGPLQVFVKRADDGKLTAVAKLVGRDHGPATLEVDGLYLSEVTDKLLAAAYQALNRLPAYIPDEELSPIGLNRRNLAKETVWFLKGERV